MAGALKRPLSAQLPALTVVRCIRAFQVVAIWFSGHNPYWQSAAHGFREM